VDGVVADEPVPGVATAGGLTTLARWSAAGLFAFYLYLNRGALIGILCLLGFIAMIGWFFRRPIGIGWILRFLASRRPGRATPDPTAVNLVVEDERGSQHQVQIRGDHHGFVQWGHCVSVVGLRSPSGVIQAIQIRNADTGVRIRQHGLVRAGGYALLSGWLALSILLMWQP